MIENKESGLLSNEQKENNRVINYALFSEYRSGDLFENNASQYDMIFVDDETGAEYFASANSGTSQFYNMCPRLDRDGKPMVEDEIWHALLKQNHKEIPNNFDK